MDLALLFPPHRQQLSRRGQLLAQGMTDDSLNEALRSGVVVRVGRRVYSPARLPARGRYLLTDGVLDRGYLAEVRALLLEISKSACAGGRTAALLWNWDLAVEPTGIEVVLPSGSWFRRPGVTVTQLVDRTVVQRRHFGYDPIACLDAVGTVLHCALVLPRREAVTVADSAMRARSVTLTELKQGLRRHHGKRGYRRMRQVVDWSDPQCGSVLESLFRVLMLEAGILRPASQVTLSGVGRVDFVWRDHRLVVECDGQRWHNPADRRNSDRRRDNALNLSSWLLLRYTWADVVHDPDRVVREVRLALLGWAAAS